MGVYTYTNVWKVAHSVGMYGEVDLKLEKTFPHAVLTVYFQGENEEWIPVKAEIDSIPGYSPVRTRDTDGYVDIVELSDLWNLIQGPVLHLESGEEVKQADNTIYAFSAMRENGREDYNRISQMIRHPYVGNLIRLNAYAGVVDVSPNHSVIVHNKSGFVSNAADVRPGDTLFIPYKPARINQKRPCYFFGNEALAWLYGFFAAEGSAYTYFSPNPDGFPCSVRSVGFSNKDTRLLEKASAIMTDSFNVNEPFWSESHEVKKICWRNKHLYNHFRPIFYTGSSKKKVPREILNAPAKAMRSFLTGYDIGDGCRAHPMGNFTTNSQSLADGLVYLMQTVDHRPLNTYTRNDKPDIIALDYGLNLEVLEGGQRAVFVEERERVKAVRQITYSGYLYDIEIANKEHTFYTGIGPVKVHNSGADMTVLPQSIASQVKAYTAPQATIVRQVAQGSQVNGYMFLAKAALEGKVFMDQVLVLPGDVTPLLGRTSLLENFKVTLEKDKFEVTPY